ncbi:MAG: beta-lactamase family protein [Muribaculaceae bacterium]|nr:beta-lactamase family protein [Muribaculaceae bacterium]
MNNKTKNTLSRRCLRLILPVLALLGAACVYCISADEKAAASLPPCPISAPMDSIFRSLFPSENEPGAIVEVMRHGQIIYRGCFGIADLESHSPITDSTVFNISSTSKLFSVAGIMKLVEEGRISLDDNLSDFFPEFPDNVFKHITIRHILTHTSGLPDLQPQNEQNWREFTSGNRTPFANLRDFQLFGSEDEHIKVFSQLTATPWPPGTHYNSFDPTLTLLAPLLERITGENYDTWMRLNIFEPAGMTETFYYKVGGSNPKMAHAYRPSVPGEKLPGAYQSPDGKWQEYDYGEVPYFLTKSNRGLFTSARSFMRWINKLYDGEIISQESLSQMGVERVEVGVPHSFFGYGTAVRLEPGYPRKNYHINRNGAFSIIDGTWPEQHTSYIIFSNRNDWDMRTTAAKVDSIIKANYF